MTREIAEENELGIDEEGFIKEMTEQKNKAREAFRSKESSAWGSDSVAGLDSTQKTVFTGYETLVSEASVLYIIKDGELVDNAQEGDEITVFLIKPLSMLKVADSLEIQALSREVTVL